VEFVDVVGVGEYCVVGVYFYDCYEGDGGV